MIRPRVHDAQLSQAALLDCMRDSDYPFLDWHEPIIDYAFVFTCEAGDKVAGFIWCYVLAEDDTACFFSRRLVNAMLATAWVSGIDRVIVEDSHTEMLMRVGGCETDDGAELKLPHKWG